MGLHRGILSKSRALYARSARTPPKNLAHPLHPVYDDGKGGGWKWWE